MTLKELKKQLIDIDKTITWLAQQLGYSTAYLYRMIDTQNEKEIARIKDVLKSCE